MTKKSILFFDIDGTLLDDKKQLPLSTKASIANLKEKGHTIAIATGRAPFMFTDLREELDIHTFVSYNGQYVVVDGEIVYTNPLKVAPLLKLTEEALHRNHPVVFMDHEDMKTNIENHPHIIESMTSLKMNLFPSFDPYYYEKRDLYQALLFCTEEEEKQYMEKYNDFEFIRWHPLSVDILPKGGSKAKGIEKIVEKLGFSSEQVYAFGDGLNDIEMLSTVHNSIAMGNAEEKVKSVAKYVTHSVNDNGIQHGLKMLGLL